MSNNRYLEISAQSNIINGEPREMVLLRGKPCSYGQCAFCDYHLDNQGFSKGEIEQFNEKALENVTGKLGVLEIINSGSIFEIPHESLELIYEICRKKKIKTLYFEAFLSYAPQIASLKAYFMEIGTEVKFRLGVESFNEMFRMETLNKKIHNSEIEKFANLYESACLLVGIEGQTDSMIEEDIQRGLELFNKITVNVFVENSTEMNEDRNLIEWFKTYHKKYIGDSRVEIFLNNHIF